MGKRTSKELAARGFDCASHDARYCRAVLRSRAAVAACCATFLAASVAACGGSDANPTNPVDDSGTGVDASQPDATIPDGNAPDATTDAPAPAPDAEAGSDAPAPPQGASILTQHNDNARTGANLRETALTTANVSPASFGRLFARAVDDQVYAQPLVYSGVSIPGKGTVNVLYVVTMSDTIYAFDADDPAAGSPLWTVSLVDPTTGVVPVTHTDVGMACGRYLDIGGNIGIESTPVIDSATGTMFVVAKTKDRGVQVYRLHALDVATGAERAGSPVVIGASVPGTGVGSAAGFVTFDASLENQRPALLLSSGKVYIGFSSYCDTGNYHGWLIAYDAATLARAAAFNVTPDGALGGIWMSGQGPSADDQGNVYVKIANGDTTVQGGGTGYSEALLLMTPALAPVDWFVPYDYANLNATDLEVGSSGLLLLQQDHRTISGSKKSKIYVNDTGNLGHFSDAGDSQIVQTISLDAGELHGSPVLWPTSAGELVYVWAADDTVRSFQVTGGMLTAAGVGTSPSPGWPGGSLTVSANGATPGTGILWASMPLTGANEGLIPGILRALDAAHVDTELWNSRLNPARDDCGFYAKYASPTVANGKVYLPSFSNRVCVYGLMPDDDAGTLDAATCSEGPSPSFANSCKDCNISDACLLTCAGCTRIDGTVNLDVSLQLPCATGSVVNNNGTLVCL
jgi:hypothetical protein